MRALIRCTTDLSPEEIEAALRQIGWWPALAQDHPEVAARRGEILAAVAPEDRAVVAQTAAFTIYNDEMKTWGLINLPTARRMAIRLSNPVTRRLQRACELLVSSLQDAVGKPDANGVDHLDFLPDVQFLLPQSATIALHGEIISETRLQALLQERRVEFRNARAAFVLALIVLAVTTPPVEKPLIDWNEAWARWLFGNLERLGTAAITTTLFFVFDIVNRLRALKENTLIRWL